jgi:protein TIF31
MEPKADFYTAGEPTTNPEHATNGNVEDGTVTTSDKPEGEAEEVPQGPESVFQLTIKLPHNPGETQLMVSTQEQVQDIRQSIVDQPHTFQYSCFHLEHKGKRINDFVELSEVPDIMEDPVCTLVEDPYTEAQARMHIVRVRELIGAAGDRTDLVLGIDAGTSLCDGVEITDSKDQKEETNPVTGYDLNAPGPISAMLAKLRDPAPKTIKSLSLSQWNPPPYDLRNRGHLLYLNVTTNEGEQFPVTSHVSGFYVNRSTNQKFDPAPRTAPKPFSAHSLISLIGKMSPSFDAAFSSLQEYNGQRDPLASYQLSNSIPAAPWLVKASSLQQHQPDLARSQEALLLSGADNMETLRDWNEEFQSTRELPKETVQDRVFRERLTSKLFAEYNEAAVRGACLVARGEVQPLNPTEERDAQIYVYNNVFYSFGADGAGTFTSDGGDEAARVAVGKDVQGVKNVNQMDIDGLCTPGTVVVDYLGKRIVGQSIVPGIFKQRDPGENQIDYGGVEGKDVIAEHDGFVKPFSELSKNMRVKKHAVWDKEGKKHDLEASVETKGLLGTDGRKYVLDLYRVTPLDISWLEQHRGDGQTDEKRYPHRMTVLRPELVDSYRITKLREYIAKQLEEKREAKKAEEGAEKKDGEAKDDEAKDGEAKDGETKDTEEKPKQQETVDVSGFTFTLNPDVFSGQIPQSEEEKASYQEDEADVRTVCEYLRSDVIPRFLRDLQEGETGFPMDGASLTSSLHKRGINVRYLGELARLAGEKEDNRMKALKQICEQEMVSRAFKHVANKQLRDLPPAFSQSCIAHLLNCLLGAEYNAEPQSEFDQDLKAIYPETDFSVEKITPQTLKDEIVRQVALRYRHDIEGDVVQSGKQLQMLREVSLKLGFQLEAKDYAFTKSAATEQSDLKEKSSSDSLKVPQTNGTKVNEGGNKKKNKKRNADHSPARPVAAAPAAPAVTFHPENVFNTVPIIKEASPRSILAEEALDAGRMSIQQDQKDLGQELLLESLSLHEQIYGILHPEVARVYYALSTIYYSLDEKAGAVELAKKAVIVSERTLGVDSTETILAYLNLSLFEHATGNTRNALALVRHALDLWKVVYGIKHPDSMTTINNAAVMLQTLKHFHDSRLWFEASLAICEEVAGKQSINTATLLFQLAQAHALDHDSKTAVAKMRESYNIFKAELGADNQNTKEAETWLETLTHSAVSQAKQAQQLLTNRKMLLRNSGRPGAPSSARTVMPQPPNGQSTRSMPEALQQATGRNDQKSVDELLKYINGEGAGKQSSKKKTTNPKKRQQQKA